MNKYFLKFKKNLKELQNDLTINSRSNNNNNNIIQ